MYNDYKEEWIALAEKLAAVKENKHILPDGKAWITKVEKANEEMRKLLGGDRRTIKVSLEDYCIPIEDAMAQKYQAQLSRVIPNYFGKYNFNYRVLKTKRIEIPGSKNYGMLVSRHIMKYTKLDKGRVIWSQIQDLNKTMDEWSKEISRNEVKSKEIYATLSVNPLDFARLGEFGCDTGSCFGQAGCNVRHKFYLGMHPGSFVIMITEDGKITNDLHGGNNLARLWGIAEENLTLFNVCNYYPKKGQHDGSLRAAIKAIVSNVLDCSVANLKVVQGKIDIKGVFHNNRSESDHPINWSCFDKSKHSFELKDPRLINVNDKIFPEKAKCQNCSSINHDDIELQEIEGLMVCQKCVDKCKVCGISGRKTLRYIVVYKEKTFELMPIIPGITGSENYVAFNQEYYHKNDLVNHMGKYYFRKDNHKFCPQCQNTVPKDKEMCDMCTQTIRVFSDLEVLVKEFAN